MCLIFFASNVHPAYRLILIANRDEFYGRATAPLDFQGPHNDLLCGTDLEAGGTWLGVNRQGRFAAVTNFRGAAPAAAGQPSRGLLVTQCLADAGALAGVLGALRRTMRTCSGCNLIAGDERGLWYVTNQQDGLRPLAPGIYGLSNHLLDMPWPKLTAGKERFARLAGTPGALDVAALFALMRDPTRPADADLPDTGVGLDWERILAPIFIASPHYGTRTTTLLLIETSGRIRMTERTHAVPRYGIAATERHSGFEVAL